MRGEVSTASAWESARALPLYLKKFPFSRALLPAGSDSLASFEKSPGVRLYRFRADQVEWTDNRIRFGYRCRLTL
jgi:uncharacterized protein YhbP (UPF0306 family)